VLNRGTTGRIFGFQGDLYPGNQINIIEWPITPFARTVPTTTVPALLGHSMEAAWTRACQRLLTTFWGLFNANDPDTEELSARLLYPIPHHYVPLCLGCTYTPRAFWMDVIGQQASGTARRQLC
jgi:hypothetical protein